MTTGWLTFIYSAYVNFVCKTSSYAKYTLNEGLSICRNHFDDKAISLKTFVH